MKLVLLLHEKDMPGSACWFEEEQETYGYGAELIPCQLDGDPGPRQLNQVPMAKSLEDSPPSTVCVSSTEHPPGRNSDYGNGYSLPNVHK